MSDESRLIKKLKAVSGRSDAVYVPRNSHIWAVQIDFDNYHDVCKIMGRDHEPTALILTILNEAKEKYSDSRSRIISGCELLLVGGKDAEHHFQIAGYTQKRDVCKIFEDSDFPSEVHRVGWKQRIESIGLKVPGSGEVIIGFGPPSGTRTV